MLKYYSIVAVFMFGTAISVTQLTEEIKVQHIDMSDYPLVITAGE